MSAFLRLPRRARPGPSSGRIRRVLPGAPSFGDVREPVRPGTPDAPVLLAPRPGPAARAAQRGQAMVEYVVVVALVAVAAIAVYQLFGQVIRAQTAAMAREIAGEDGSEQSRIAQTAAESAAAQAAAKSLKSFTGNAAAGQ
ncbi:Putative membrane protein OS=Castellaniella defragrans (strain DSM / CCUG 39792 / 65Phen) OX=1437824 GN=BN940_09556 PE=4 SV=1 [Castellaniella denitrificans]